MADSPHLRDDKSTKPPGGDRTSVEYAVLYVFVITSLIERIGFTAVFYCTVYLKCRNNRGPTIEKTQEININLVLSHHQHFIFSKSNSN